MLPTASYPPNHLRLGSVSHRRLRTAATMVVGNVGVYAFGLPWLAQLARPAHAYGSRRS